MGRTEGSHKTQYLMISGALLCVIAAILSFFIGSFEGLLHIIIVTVLLICTFGGILLVGLGIRASRNSSQ